MNIKDAKLLRLARIHYIAACATMTPEGMTAAMGDIVQAADRLQGMVVEYWPKLNHKQRGKAVQQLRKACITPRYTLSDALGHIIRS